jgi:uncharacterized lipoprotein
MKLVKNSARLVLPAIALAMLSACGQRETLRSVPDFCLNSQRITVSVAPAAGANDPGNQFDTDETTTQVFGHNAVVDRLCPL